MKNKVSIQLFAVAVFVLLTTNVVGQSTQNQYGQEETPTGIQIAPITEIPDNTPPTDITPYDLDKVNLGAPVIREQTHNRIENWQERKEAYRERIQEKIETKKEQLIQKKQQFREKLQLLKNEKKQATAARLEENLNGLNNHLVDRLAKRAETFETILEKIDSRAEKLEAEEAYVDGIYSGINSIQTEIDQFKILLTAQAEKDYIPELNTESTLKIDIGAKHQELQTDLKTLRDSLISIRKQIVSLVQSLKATQESLSVETSTVSPGATIQ